MNDMASKICTYLHTATCIHTHTYTPLKAYVRLNFTRSNYALERKIGNGTFGEVHRARDEQDYVVALKKILMENEV